MRYCRFYLSCFCVFIMSMAALTADLNPAVKNATIEEQPEKSNHLKEQAFWPLLVSTGIFGTSVLLLLGLYIRDRVQANCISHYEDETYLYTLCAELYNLTTNFSSYPAS